MLFSFILLTFLVNFHLDEACFITNCPPGGKRSHGDIDHMRECLRCGPGNKGHCVNSNVCCGSDFGCLINNHYSAPCRAENFIPIPCKVPGKLCSSGQGVCVSNGICCSSGGCFNDLTCENDTTTNDESIQRIFDAQFSPYQMGLDSQFKCNVLRTRLDVQFFTRLGKQPKLYL